MICLNQRNFEFSPGLTLLELLKKDNVDIHDAVLIVLNGSLIRKENYASTLLCDGDEVLAIRVSTGG